MIDSPAVGGVAADASSSQTKLRLVVMNADNFRGPAVADELRSLVPYTPAVIAVVEAIGNPTPPLPGYELLASDKTPGRSNVAAYVRRDLNPRNVAWHPCQRTWPRTEGPGPHWPREALTFDAGHPDTPSHVVVAHHPPTAPGSGPARDEHYQLLVELARKADHGPLFVLFDGNGVQDRLARRIGGRVIGTKIDCAVARDVARKPKPDWTYLSSWPRLTPAGTADGRVRFGGDHGHIFAADVWLPEPRRRD